MASDSDRDKQDDSSCCSNPTTYLPAKSSSPSCGPSENQPNDKTKPSQSFIEQSDLSACDSASVTPLASAGQGSCCADNREETVFQASSGCCGSSAVGTDTEQSSGCCGGESKPGWRGIDWLLWLSLSGVTIAYSTHLLTPEAAPGWLQTMGQGVYELINTMWWGVILAALFVGLIGRIPQQMIISILGVGGTVKGLWRATLAGVLLDLCSHGILMVGMQLYRRGASSGQVIAFLLASPWNSLSLTIILVALIGLPYTLLFVVLSMAIALVVGWLFDRLVHKGTLPANPNQMELPEGYHFWSEVKASWSRIEWSPELVVDMLWDGIKGSRMVLRWLLFGVLLATAVRGFVQLEDFQAWFGPTAVGLLVTLVAATIIEVCSEGSTPIAADLVTRAGAPGNGFAFLMTGVSTDYTEVMVLRDTTHSWKIALYLPLLTVPQVFVVSMILNGVLG